jgi:N-carbamoylputrescine amidase
MITMARSFTIALGQIAADETKEATLAKAVSFAERAADSGADIIVFPEVGMTKFFPQFRADPRWFEQAEPIPGGPTCDALQDVASRRGIAVVVSLLEHAGMDTYYDTAAVIGKKGELLGIQRMMHIAEEENYNEKYYYKPGNSNYPVFDVGGVRIGIAVCQDQFFPEHIRLLALHGAEVVLVPTAISAESDPMLLASRSGAALNHVFFAGVNRVGTEVAMTFVGNSHVVDPLGEVIKTAETKADELVVCQIDVDRVKEVRSTQNFWFRDRRPETYGDLTKA